VAGVRVEAQIIAQKRGKKIIIFKHRRRKGYRRKQGHRQSLTSLRVTGIYTSEQSIEQQSIEQQSIEHDEPPPLSEEGIAEERQHGT
jgi:large subunit ribosomal protein L21